MPLCIKECMSDIILTIHYSALNYTIFHTAMVENVQAKSYSMGIKHILRNLPAVACWQDVCHIDHFAMYAGSCR